MTAEEIRGNPLLGPLMGRPPRGVVTAIGYRSRPGKRVRLKVGQALRAARRPMALGELRQALGLHRRELSAALAKMRQAGEVRFLPNFAGRCYGYELVRS